MAKRRGLGRVTTPSIRQRQDSECAVAALAIILGHYGRHVPMEQLRQETGVSRDGSRLSIIAATARRHGLVVQSFSRPPETLADLGFPLIVQVDFNHMIVVEGLDAENVRVNDPARGPYLMPMAEFDDRFTGIVLRMRPGPDFTQLAPTPGAGSVVADMARRQAGWLLFILVATLGGWTAAAYAALQPEQAALPLAMAALLLTLRIWGQRHLARTITLGEGDRLAPRLLGQPDLFYRYRFARTLAGTAEAPMRLAQWVEGKAGSALLDMIALVPCLILLAHLHPLIGTGALFLTFLCLALFWRQAGRRQAPASGGDRFGAMPALPAAESLWSIGLLKLAGRHHAFLDGMLNREAQRLDQMQRAGAALLPCLLAPVALPLALTMAATWIAPAERMPIGMLCLLILYPLVRLALSHSMLRAPVEEAHAMADPGPPALATLTTGIKAAEAEAARLDQVSFGHVTGQPPVIHDLSLVLPAGSQTGLTGERGAGCSTIGLLLTGLALPWQGTVTIPAAAALVTRHGLLPGTVRDNISLFDPTVTDAAIMAALGQACIDRAVLAKPGGLDAQVTGDDGLFSGGERRRLLLARALVRQPRLLVLDGILDGLDLPLERRLREGLRHADITLVIISQRGETLAACDQCFHLKGGALAPWQAVADLSTPPPLPQIETIPLPPLAAPAPCTAAEWRALSLLAGNGTATPPLPEQTLMAAARHLGLHLRPVRLTSGWMARDHGPLLLFADDGRILPLRPIAGTYGEVTGGGVKKLTSLPALTDRQPYSVQPIADSDPTAFRAGRDLAAALLLLILAAASLLVAAYGPLGLMAALAGLVLALAAGGYWLRALGIDAWQQQAGTAARLLRLPAWHYRGLGQDTLTRGLSGLSTLLLDRPPALMMLVAGGLLMLAGVTAGALQALPAAGTMVAGGLLFGWGRARGEAARQKDHVAWEKFTFAMMSHFPVLRRLGATGALQQHARLLAQASDRSHGRTQVPINLYRALLPLLLVAGASLAGGTGLPGLLALIGGTLAAEGTFILMASSPAKRATHPLLAATPEALFHQEGDDDFSGSLALEAVRFTYPGQAQPAVDGASLMVAPGQVVALTGPSGCGKSTLLRLLLGFQPPDQGTILIDGVPCPVSRLFALRQRMDAVEQDMPLPLATVRHHLTGTFPRPLEELEAVLRLVGLWDDIAALPMGLQSLVSDSNLAASQVQRLHLARCLLTRPRLLVLDEATAALDPETERTLVATIRAMGSALLLVTHRPRTLALADHVYRMEGGRMVTA